MKRCVATLPTWNEAGNIRPLIDALLSQDPRMEVLVVDDNSPDGTGRIAAEMAATDPRVHALIRTERKGRGWAGIAGFQWAVAHGYDFVIEMDADFSHHPRYIPAFLIAIEEADVVIGSRLVSGGGEAGRAFTRRAITAGANFYIRVVLGLRVRDCTSGYRCFRREVLSGVGLERMTSQGPSIVQEVLIACRRVGARMTEIPILFEDRRIGQSTFSSRIMLQSLAMMWRFRFRHTEAARG